jgi:hypothetical protein
MGRCARASWSGPHPDVIRFFGVLGIFLAKKSFQSSKFSEGIFFTWPLFSHFVINLDQVAGQPI